jgi:hypothetical protein
MKNLIMYIALEELVELKEWVWPFPWSVASQRKYGITANGVLLAEETAATPI